LFQRDYFYLKILSRIQKTVRSNREVFAGPVFGLIKSFYDFIKRSYAAQIGERFIRRRRAKIPTSAAPQAGFSLRFNKQQRIQI